METKTLSYKKEPNFMTFGKIQGKLSPAKDVKMRVKGTLQQKCCSLAPIDYIS